MSRKNVQVIDGARNCTYEIFSMTERDFLIMFPVEGQDVEFIGDFVARVGEEEATRITSAMWRSREDKKLINGLHATLFFELDHKKTYYPTKREDQVVGSPRSAT